MSAALPKPDYYVLNKSSVVGGPYKQAQTAEKLASELAREQRSQAFVVVKAVGTFRFS